jgi:hypothetical protein
MAKYGSFKYGQAQYGVSSSSGSASESTALNTPIGVTAFDGNLVVGTQGFGIGTNLSSPSYISADNFIDNILK